ncbi:NDP-hexose 2,3-dehydratase family protein [Dactylosporangium sp. McL0621]|uniref:NDP-hexose 2,3-dehydratase family protein n=1 Tax=Dactylosporangium sp. McL0621 TaxID=3415678 RepID=UPI003CEC44A3
MSTDHEASTPARLTHSALSDRHAFDDVETFLRRMAQAREHTYTNTAHVPLGDLAQWHTDAEAGVIRHASGKFFTVQGLDVHIPTGAVPRWDQPIINQPEIGILGILMKEFDGVLHCLMQLKSEPGNCNGIQVSPTVQATRSNYTRVHGGNPTPYLDYFRDRSQHRVILDARQSEQGAWFLRKLNRNMIIEVTGPVEAREGFHWLTIAQLHELLALDDVVNMDARSVLSCMPFEEWADRSGDAQDSRHSTAELLSWITERRSLTSVDLRQVRLGDLGEWRADGARISHVPERFFDVIGVRVEACGREVGRWDQPMFAARGEGVVAFLMTRFDGVPHVLANARVEAGYADRVELAPTVQCIPDSYRDLPRSKWPPFLDDVLRADPAAIRYDVLQSEEGGRFYHTRSRHLVIETGDELVHPEFRWMTPRQLAGLLWHSNYVNVQARSLLACLRAVERLAPVERAL